MKSCLREDFNKPALVHDYDKVRSLNAVTNCQLNLTKQPITKHQQIHWNIPHCLQDNDKSNITKSDITTITLLMGNNQWTWRFILQIFQRKRSDQTPVSITSFLKKRDDSILSRIKNPLQYSIPLARTERFKRSFVLYALHSFPTDISEISVMMILLTLSAICVFCFILNFM